MSYSFNPRWTMARPKSLIWKPLPAHQQPKKIRASKHANPLNPTQLNQPIRLSTASTSRLLNHSDSSTMLYMFETASRTQVASTYHHQHIPHSSSIQVTHFRTTNQSITRPPPKWGGKPASECTGALIPKKKQPKAPEKAYENKYKKVISNSTSSRTEPKQS